MTNSNSNSNSNNGQPSDDRLYVGRAKLLKSQEEIEGLAQKRSDERIYAGHAKHAKSQVELEEIAQKQYKRRAIEQTQELASKNYYSASTHGRRLVKGSIDGVPVVQVIASQIQEKLQNKQHMSRNLGGKGVAKVISEIQWAQAAIPEYLGDTEAQPEHLLASIVLKAIVDGFGAMDGAEWPTQAGIMQRIGQLVDTQRIDAICAALAPEHYKRQQSRWTRQNQGVQNRHTNLVLGQRDILKELGHDAKDLRWNSETRGRVGQWLYVQAKAATGDAVWTIREEHIPGTKKVTYVVVPFEGFLEEYKDVLDQGALGHAAGYPLIEPPRPWVYDPNAKGVHNTGGGYHSAALQDANPQVRSRFEENETRLSELAVEFLNTLGNTALRTDEEMCESFEWAVMHSKSTRIWDAIEIKGVNPMPTETVADLDREKDQFMAHIAEHGKHPEGFLPGSPEHSDWKRSRKLRYSNAIRATKKFTRTRRALLSLKTFAEFERFWFSYSGDYRVRVYSQQYLLQPQGPKIEKALLRFADGYPLTEAGEVKVMQAIGSAFRGDRRIFDPLDPCKVLYNASFATREAWAREHLQAILDSLSGKPSDIHDLIEGWSPKNPWGALQLVRGWQRYQETGLWDVPIEADGSQSGTLILAALLRDEQTLLHVNGLNMGIQDDGPEDGYREVATNALRLLDPNDQDLPKEFLKWRKKHQLPEVIHQQVKRFLEPLDDLTRDLSKASSMPRIYGSAHQSTVEKFAEILKEAKVDLVQEVKSGVIPLPTEPRIINGERCEWTPWGVKNVIVNALASYLRESVRLTFPRAMAALDWLRKLARLSIKKQLEAGVDMPKLTWTVSDGTIVSYWETEAETLTIRSAEVGACSIACGGSDELDEGAMVRSFAPGFVHSLDALLLRMALKDWGRDVISIHDCVRCHPNHMDELLGKYKQAIATVALENDLNQLADQMGVSPEELPRLEFGSADISLIGKSRYSIH